MAFKLQGEFNLKGNALSGFKSVGSALKNVKTQGSSAGSTLKNTVSELDKAKDSALKAGVAADKLAGSYLNASGKLMDAKGKFLQVKTAADKTGSGVKGAGSAGKNAGGLLSSGAREAANAWKNTGNILNGVKDRITGVFNLPNAIAAGGIGFGIKSVIDAVGFKEQSLNSFKTMLKDSSLALKTYTWAMKTADATPFETPDVLSATKQMLAARFNLKEIPSLFTTLGDTSSSISDTPDEMKGKLQSLIRTFGQIRSAKRLTGEDLNQFTDVGIDATSALEKAYNVKGMAFKKLLESGKIGGEDAIGIVLADLKKQFGGGMDTQSKSIFGLASTLKSRAFKLFTNLDADKELKPVKNVLDNLIALTDFDKNPTGKKIKTRFVSSMNTLFSSTFGNLAKATDPKAVGKVFDTIFDKIDNALAWIKKNGPGMLEGFKSFIGGIGSVINSIKTPLEWLGGMFDKLGGAGTGLKIGGGLIAGIAAFKGLDGLLGGGLGKAAGGLLGGGVQKVFVVNMGVGGLGGSGLPSPKLPNLKLPKLGLPKLPTLPKFGLPKLGFPKLGLPKLGLPKLPTGLLTKGAGLLGRIPFAGMARGAGAVLGKATPFLAAATTGIAIGELIRKIPTGKGRNVDSSLTDFFADKLFGGDALKAQNKASDLKLEQLKKHRQNQLKSRTVANFKSQISPVQLAAQVTANRLAASGLTPPSNSSAKPALNADKQPGTINFKGGAQSLPPFEVKVSFGDIYVNGADPKSAQQTANSVRQHARDGTEQGLLEAFERLAAMVGGAT